MNPVPKRTPWYQVGSGCVPNRAGDWCDVVPGCPTAQEATDEYPGWDDCVSAAEVGLEVIDTTTVRLNPLASSTSRRTKDTLATRSPMPWRVVLGVVENSVRRPFVGWRCGFFIVVCEYR